MMKQAFSCIFVKKTCLVERQNNNDRDTHTHRDPIPGFTAEMSQILYICYHIEYYNYKKQRFYRGSGNWGELKGKKVTFPDVRYKIKTKYD